MSISVKKEVIDFKEIPAITRCQMIRDVANTNKTALLNSDDPDTTWGNLIWDQMGEDAFGFFWAIRSFQICRSKGIEIPEDQLKHWGMTADDITKIFDYYLMSFYL